MKLAVFVLALIAPAAMVAQGTRADYQRALDPGSRFDGLALHITDGVTWIGKTPRFWYRRSVSGGYEFIVVDAEKLTKKPAFDHSAIAASLSSATGNTYTATTLPFAGLGFTDGERSIEFEAAHASWKCNLADRLGVSGVGK